MAKTAEVSFMGNGVIREIPIRDRKSGREGKRKVFADRSTDDEFPESTAEKSDAAGSYPGGKAAAGVYQSIINQMPKHRIYIEPFLGGGAILRHKRPADTSWACELDPAAFNAFDPGRGFFQKCANLVEIFGGGAFDSQRQWCDRNGLPNLFLSNQDGLKFLRNYIFQGDKANTLIYLDPPYLMETRSTKAKIYAEEFHTREKHTELLSFLLTLTLTNRTNIMVSGYDHPLYNEMLSGWRKISFPGVSRGGPRTETIWMNYPEPAELHDYRYLGGDFREREQIKRQKQRWTAKLREMPVQRRYALLSAIEEFFASSAGIATNGDIKSAGIIATNSDAIAVTTSTSENEIDAAGYKGRDHVQHPTRPDAPEDLSTAKSSWAVNDHRSPAPDEEKEAAALEFLIGNYFTPWEILNARVQSDPVAHLAKVAQSSWRGSHSKKIGSYTTNKNKIGVWLPGTSAQQPDAVIAPRRLAAEVLKRQKDDHSSPEKAMSSRGANGG
jgi:DNA adenine methylase